MKRDLGILSGIVREIINNVLKQCSNDNSIIDRNGGCASKQKHANDIDY